MVEPSTFGSLTDKYFLTHSLETCWTHRYVKFSSYCTCLIYKALLLKPLTLEVCFSRLDFVQIDILSRSSVNLVSRQVTLIQGESPLMRIQLYNTCRSQEGSEGCYQNLIAVCSYRGKSSCKSSVVSSCWCFQDKLVVDQTMITPLCVYMCDKLL